MVQRYFLIVFICLGIHSLNAQFIHFTQDYLTPNAINPALTGNFYGTLRFNGVVRDQDWAVASGGNEYRSVNASGEYNLNIAFREQDWTSIGINIARLGAGVSNFVRTEAGLSGAYHMSLHKKKHQVLSFALSFGSIMNSIENVESLVDENFLLNGDYSIIQDAFMNVDDKNKLGANGTDYGLGIVYTAPAGRNNEYRVGLSMKQLVPVKVGLDGENGDQLSPEFTAFFKYYAGINKRLNFIPGALFSWEGSASRYLNLTTMLSYLVNTEKEFYLNGGLGLRTANNSQDLLAMVGADYKTWRVGLSIDLNMGRVANTSNGFGAVELGVSKIINIHKKPEVSPVLLCPRL